MIIRKDYAFNKTNIKTRSMIWEARGLISKKIIEEIYKIFDNFLLYYKLISTFDS